MTKETSKEIANIASMYIDCPDFDLRLLSVNGVLVAPPKVIEALANLIAEQEKESEK